MKKILVLLLALLGSGALLAQAGRVKTKLPSTLAVHAGPSVPLGVFSSSYPSNDEAGYAKTGINLGLTYEYQLNELLNIAVNTFYNQHNTKKLEFTLDLGDGTQTIVFTADKWHAYGIAAGPGLTYNLGKNLNAGIHVMGGIANVRMPAFYYDGEEAVKADWGIAPLVQGDAGLKVNAGKQFFFFLNAEYQYMKPVFHLLDISTNETDKVYQKISVLNATAGIGIRF